jgi:integrase
MKNHGTTPASPYWTSSELVTFLDGLTGPPRLPFHLAAMAGLRVRELLALRWRDVADGEVRVERMLIAPTTCADGHEITECMFWELSGGTSRRTVKLDTRTNRMVRFYYRRERLNQRETGPRCVDDRLIVCTPAGGPITPQQLSRDFDLAVRAAGLRPIGLHALHRTHQALFVEAIRTESIRERLGEPARIVGPDGRRPRPSFKTTPESVAELLKVAREAARSATPAAPGLGAMAEAGHVEELP